MPNSPDWFEKIWETREEVVYPKLFGDSNEGIFPISHTRLQEAGLSDPRWSTCGVFAFEPTHNRNTWLYASSGLSNAWFDEKPADSGVSGFGCEYVLEALSRSDWPIHRLHQIMCYELAVGLGYTSGNPITEGNRIPLGSPVDLASSELGYLVVVRPTQFEARMQLASGSADFLQLVGVSESECDFAKTAGHNQLVDWLSENTCYPATDPRRSVM